MNTVKQMLKEALLKRMGVYKKLELLITICYQAT